MPAGAGWFVLNAHDVEPGSEWTLVATLAGEAGDEAVCLGSATANNGGQLHINANFDPESNLPPDFDPFAEDDSAGEGDGEGEERVHRKIPIRRRS